MSPGSRQVSWSPSVSITARIGSRPKLSSSKVQAMRTATYGGSDLDTWELFFPLRQIGSVGRSIINRSFSWFRSLSHVTIEVQRS